VQPADIIRGAAEEVLAALKVDAKKDDVKKKEIEVRINLHTRTHSLTSLGCLRWACSRGGLEGSLGREPELGV
jgi:hypothetical protein